MVLIGDGVMALVCPRSDAKAWQTGWQPWRKLMKSLGDHPNITRAIGIAQIAAGVAWALSEEKRSCD